MPILVTGITGFVGGAITRELLKQGQEVRALVRPLRGRRPLDLLNEVEVVEGDLLRPETLELALEGVNRVYHAAGIINWDQTNATTIYRINTEGAVNLFRAAQRAEVARLVHTSSVYALGYTPDPERPVTEDHTFNADEFLDIPYIRAKRDSELAAQQAIARGTNIIRLYTGTCLGPGDTRRSSTAIIDLWLQGRLPAIITGGGIPVIDVRDAAQAHLAAMERGTIGRRYIAAGTNLTLEQLFEQMATVTDQPPPTFKLSSGLGLPIANLTDRLGLLRAIDSAQARLMTRYWWCSNRRAIGELGVRFRPLENTYAEMIDWLQRNRIFA